MLEVLKDKKFLINSELVNEGEFAITRNRLRDQLNNCLEADKEVVSRGEKSDETTCYMAYWFNYVNAIVSRALVTLEKYLAKHKASELPSIYTDEYVTPEILYMIAEVMSGIRGYMNMSINDIKWKDDIDKQRFYYNLGQLEDIATYFIDQEEKAIELVN